VRALSDGDGGGEEEVGEEGSLPVLVLLVAALRREEEVDEEAAVRESEAKALAIEVMLLWITGDGEDLDDVLCGSESQASQNATSRRNSSLRRLSGQELTSL